MALIVEDSITERTLLTALARKQGLNVVEASDAESARAVVERETPDLILLDVHLPGVDGLSLLSRIRDEHPFVPVVVISSSTDARLVEDALNLGAVNFLHKPVKAAEFRFVVNRIARMLEEEEDVQEALESITERSTQMSIPCNPNLLPRVVAYLGREVRQHYPGHPVPLPDIKLALYEALANAVDLHLDAPYIPIFLNWPNDDTAVELLRKSLKFNPNHISGQYHYAKALNQTGNKERAIEVLKKVTLQEPNTDQIMEEESELDLCKKLLLEITK